MVSLREVAVSAASAKQDPLSSNEQRQTGAAGTLSLEEVIRKYRTSVMRMAGVVGIAGGLSRDRSRTCVLVYTEAGAWPDELATELDGYPVELINTGGGFRVR